ncbi:MAG: class I SAM-dependent methyltransferase [Patescibacteria group bacterium]
MNDLYKNDFEFFLAHTSEKQILGEEILKDIQRFNVESLLDIGAGNGLLSIPLSKSVKRYLAVEPTEKFAGRLKKAGLEVICSTFPVRIDGQFDMVLSSHVISYRQKYFRSFIRRAWKLVKPGGVFLLVTFRGQGDDWDTFTKSLGEDRSVKRQGRLDDILELLRSLGEVQIRKVVTHVRSKSLDDMITALSFVYSNGFAEDKNSFMKKSETVKNILTSKYKSGTQYVFPFQHLFVYGLKKG